MNTVLELLRIILCWPVAVILLCWLFRNELRLLLSEIGKALGQRMKKATIAGATFEFAEAQAQAIKDTVERAAVELKDDPKQLADFLSEQVRKAVGIRVDPARSQAPLEGKRILWADDKPEGNTYEVNLFRRLGADIQLCVSTEEALQALRTSKYDLVISDVFRMENGSRNRSAGYDLLDAVKSAWPNLPLIFYTTNSSRISPSRGKGAFGASDTPDELSRLVIEAARSSTENAEPAAVPDRTGG